MRRPARQQPMPPRPALAGHRARASHPALLCLLVAALWVYACSAATLRVVGPAHWHAPAAQGAGVWQSGAQALAPAFSSLQGWLGQIRALSDRAHDSAHALGLAVQGHGHAHGKTPAQATSTNASASASAPTHAHAGVLRHWHEADDRSVRAVGPSPSPAAATTLADLEAAAAIGAATLLPALGPCCLWPPGSLANGRWPASQAAPWRSALPLPPIDPPIA
ncbi:hypothetical protein [Aquabacterium sp. OR-4]|uniref:hypothetical protein n=1 Tax=Aquabacterium sp. OR-4 TaxID=2978127 RepID=UPI0028C8E548|nr:hypothetical protein [Aquabacterium sp. OR-4]MDT7835824.1 hypothetical protein [Aquabacterium sp. OR-4]